MITTLRLAGAILALAAAPFLNAQSKFPERPISIMVAPGLTAPTVNILAEALSKELKVPASALTPPTAESFSNLSALAAAAPDGYTIALTTPGALVIQTARSGAKLYTPDQFDYVCGTSDLPLVATVAANSPHKTYAALVAWAKANPGKLKYGSLGTNSTLYLSSVQQWGYHGVEAVHVPYKTRGEMIAALRNGDIGTFNDVLTTATQNKLTALMVIADQRIPGLDGVQTSRELAVPVGGSVWWGIVAPKGLPAEVRARLQAACKAALSNPDYAARAEKARMPVVWRSGEDFRRLVAEDFGRYQKALAGNATAAASSAAPSGPVANAGSLASSQASSAGTTNPRTKPPSSRRLALVIGNNKYRSVPALVNAVDDAASMAANLRDAGYQVTLQLDLPEREMKAAIRTFVKQLQGGDEALFFFAGHGVQLGAANYLLPVDIAGESETQVRDEAVPLQRVLDDISEQKVRFTLAIVDACRDNPFKSSGRAIGGRGLAPTAAASGQMIIFSAGTGQQALDKLGPSDKSRNGLFTRVLLKEMQKPGISVDRLVRNVRAEVVSLAKSIGHEQVPAIYDQAIGDFYFR